MSVFLEELKRFNLDFNKNLLAEIDTNVEKAKNLNEISEIVMSDIKRLVVNGGKRVRPFLAYIGYNLARDFQNQNSNLDLLNLEICLEFFQTFALIHDDIIDKSILRRNQPTIQAHFNEFFEDEHYGLTAAILAGDWCQMLADEYFSRVETGGKNLYQVFNQMKFEVNAGQLDDSLGITREKLENLDEKRIFSMLNYKSGLYSVEKPLLLGAVLGGFSDLTLLSKIGKNLGLLFQLIDDYLGVFGVEEDTGKSAISDITEGKKTWLMFLAYKHSENPSKVSLILDSKKQSLEDINWLKTQIPVDIFWDYCRNLVQENTENFKFLPDSTAKKVLLDFQKWLLERTS